MVRIQEEPLEPATELMALLQTGAGAVASFVGVVRPDGVPPVTALILEAYPPMTQAALEAIGTEARQRWSLQGVHIVHRTGYLVTGTPIVFVGVSAAHRAEAFAACEFLVDYLKTQAPFWKRELTAEGGRWVEPHVRDTEALRRWVHG